MNIFYLDHDPQKAAEYQCNKHVVKMILESAQLLSTTHYVFKSVYLDVLYKPTHINHPCSIWVRQSHQNYNWLYQHYEALCDEYTWRYGKSHKSESLSSLLKKCPVLENKPSKPALAMPDEFKVDCPVESYRNYYRHKSKSIKMVWPQGQTPDFMKELI